MFGPRTVRTGIDLGGAAVKLVRGRGVPQLQAITHVGWEPIGEAVEGRIISVGVAPTDDPERAPGPDPATARAGLPDAQPSPTAADLGSDTAGKALKRLLGRLQLGRRNLGRVAVGLGGEAASFREVELPPLTEAELRRALPFEARRHLNLDQMTDPVLDFQILGPGDQDPETGAEQVRVLLAAVARGERDRLLKALRVAGVEPEVVDLQPLAGLNAVLAQMQPPAAGAIALLDVGARHAAVHVSGTDGALLSRTLPGGGPPTNGERLNVWCTNLAAQLSETLTFYRGRQRRQVESVVLAGYGSLVPGLRELLQQNLKTPLTVLDPLASLADGARGREDAQGREPLFLTACGLCRWWDGADV
ncbi:MAG: pilus assembly protein PilM [Candidatus Krumholzibacteriia bacterium]